MAFAGGFAVAAAAAENGSNDAVDGGSVAVSKNRQMGLAHLSVVCSD